MKFFNGFTGTEHRVYHDGKFLTHIQAIGLGDNVGKIGGDLGLIPFKDFPPIFDVHIHGYNEHGIEHIKRVKDVRIDKLTDEEQADISFVYVTDWEPNSILKYSKDYEIGY